MVSVVNSGLSGTGSWVRHLTFKVPPSSQVYKWALGVTLWWTNVPSKVE